GALGARDLLRRRARNRELRARAGDRARAASPAGALRETAENGDRVGLRLLLATALAAAAATPVGFLQAHQAPSGAFAESSGSPGPLLTAWAALGLRASGASTGNALQYLAAREAGLSEVTDVELVAIAEAALARKPVRLLARAAPAQRRDGRG